MSVNLYEGTFSTSFFGAKRSLYLEFRGVIAEISPLKGYSDESIEEAHQCIATLMDSPEKLDSIPPSVEWALWVLMNQLKIPKQFSIPICRLLMGTEQQIMEKFTSIESTHLKIKLNRFSYEISRKILKQITSKKKVKLRLDFGSAHLPDEIHELQREFHDFIEYLEEPFEKQWLQTENLPLAIDHQLKSIPQEALEKVLAEQVVVYKPMLLGYRPDILRKAKKLSLSSSFESQIGIAILASFWQSLPLEKRLIPGLDTLDGIDDGFSFIQVKNDHLIGNLCNVFSNSKLKKIQSFPLSSLQKGYKHMKSLINTSMSGLTTTL